GAGDIRAPCPRSKSSRAGSGTTPKVRPAVCADSGRCARHRRTKDNHRRGPEQRAPRRSGRGIGRGYRRTTTSNTRALSMAKIGRNEPCPCKSGKKYKRCCEPKAQAQAAEAAAEHAQAAARARLAAKEELRRGREIARAMMGDPRYVIEDDDLDETS